MKNYINNIHLLDFNVYNLKNWGIFLFKMICILDGLACVGIFGWLACVYFPEGDWIRAFMSVFMVCGGSFIVAVYPLLPYKR